MRALRLPARAAFTLIEIMMVVVLIGIMLGFAVSRVNFTGYRMDSNVRLMQNVLIGAQQTAITKSAYVQVLFYRNSDSLRVLVDNVTNDGLVSPGETVVYRSLDGAVFLTPAATLDGALANFVTGVNIVEQGVNRGITFAPNGSVGGNAVIYLGTTNTATDTRALVITGATARTAFWSYGSGAWREREY